jgi:chromosome segregation ATPase
LAFILSPSVLRQVSPEEVEETAAKLEAQAHAQEVIMLRLTPNLKAAAMLEEVERKLATEASEVAAARAAQQEAESRYREVAAARRSLFEAAFSTVQVR